MSEGAVGGDATGGEITASSTGAAAALASAGEQAAGVGDVSATGAAASTGDVAPITVPEWAQGLDHDSQVIVAKQQWQTPDDVVTSYKNLRALSDDGARLKLPSSEDDVEGWREVNRKLGMPETAEEYELPEIEVAEGEVNLIEKFREWSHKRGLSQKAAAGISEDYIEFWKASKEAEDVAWKASQATGIEKTKLAWGENYEANRQIGGRAAALLGLNEKMMVEIEKQVGTDVMLDTMLRVGQSLGEHQAGGQGREVDGLMGAEQARAEIKRLMADTEYARGWTAGDAEKVQHMSNLHQIAHSKQVLDI
jgi:hypothetical protein